MWMLRIMPISAPRPFARVSGSRTERNSSGEVTGKERRMTTRSKNSSSPSALMILREMSPPADGVNHAFSGVRLIETRCLKRSSALTSSSPSVFSLFSAFASRAVFFFSSALASAFLSAASGFFASSFTAAFFFSFIIVGLLLNYMPERTFLMASLWSLYSL